MIAIVDGRCEQCRARIKPGDLLTSIDDQWCWTDCATKAGFNPDKRERGGP